MFNYQFITDKNAFNIIKMGELSTVITLLTIIFLLVIIVIRKRRIPFKKNFILLLILLIFCSVIHLIEFTNILNEYMYLLSTFKLLGSILSIVTTIFVIRDTTRDINMPTIEELRNSMFDDMYDVLGALPVGIIISNNSGQIVYTNRYINKLFGYEDGELNMSEVEVLLSQIKRTDHINFRNSFFKNPTEKLMGSGRVLEGITKGGETKYLEIALKPMGIEFKKQGNLIIAISDVTNDHYNKKIIENKNQLINVATFCIPSLLSYLDKDGYYRFVNDAYTKYWAKKADNIINSHYRDLLPPESIEQVEKNIEKATSGNEVNFKMEIIFPTIGKRNLDVFYIPHYNEDKTKVLGIIVLCHDYTELMNAKDELEDKNKQLEEYAFLVSHDLRAPIRHISNFLELLKIEFENQEKLTLKEKKYMQVILENSSKIQQMISGMLKLASINQIQPKIDIMDLDIFFNSFFTENFSKVVLSITSQTKSLIKADKDLLSLIFNNLVQNSIKFSNPNSCVINITISKKIDRIVVVIQDHGVGIPEENYKNIFAAFFKDNSSDGLGLGLNIVKKAMTKMNGTIEILPSDKGACFQLEFDVGKN